MKKLCVLYLILVLLPSAGRCQLWLNAGDTYIHQFTNFSLSNFAETTLGTTLYLGMSEIDGSDQFLTEVFEDNASDPPLMTFRGSRFIPLAIHLGNAWSDRQGVVRFTVTSGSVSLNYLFATIVYPDGDVYHEISDFVPKDSDEDGVFDLQDQCPHTTEMAIVDEHGCSLVPPVAPIVAETGKGVHGWVAYKDLFTGVSWTQNNAYQDVKIMARLRAHTPGKTGNAYLTTRIGPGTTLADQVAVVSFTFPSNPSPSNVLLFSGLTLGPGTYYLIVAGETNYGPTWYGSREPHVTSDVGVTHNGSFYVDEPALYAPASVPHNHSTMFQIFAVSGTRMPADRPPVANAGTDQRIECSGTTTSVLLDGRESGDPDGDALSYKWWEGGTQLGVGSTLNVNLFSGSHDIRLIVTDTSGNSAEDRVLVDIQDTIAPHMAAFATPPVLWPPNGKMVPVSIEAKIFDACDAMTSGRIVAVESDELSFRSDDWEITGPLTLNLKARRLGTGKGRTYRITIEASDGSGNMSRTTVSIFVPRS